MPPKHVDENPSRPAILPEQNSNSTVRPTALPEQPEKVGENASRRAMPPRFNCSSDNSKTEHSWTAEMHKFCCGTAGRECVHNASANESSFDCQAGIIRWQHGWSDE